MLAGFKTKDLANDLQVSIRRVRRWRAKGYLECVSGRITEDSFERFCRNHPDKIPYRQLSRETQRWLDSFGYQTDDGYRVAQLATMLHVSPKTVRRWTAMNWIEEHNKRIPEDALARLCRLHPEVIRVEELSLEAKMLLERLGFRGGMGEKDGSPGAFSTLVTSECA